MRQPILSSLGGLRRRGAGRKSGLCGAAVAAAALLGFSVGVARAEGFAPRRDFPIVNGIVRTMAIDEQAGVLYLGGDFSLVTPFAGEVKIPVSQAVAVSRLRLAALDLHSGAILPWNPGADGEVDQLFVVGGQVYAFGRFQQIGGVARRFAGALDAAGTVLPWDPKFSAGQNMDGADINFDFDSVAAVGNVFYLFGDFTEVGGVARAHAAAVDTDGTLLPWEPVTGTDYPDFVTGIAAIGSTLYLGGYFDKINGVARNHLAAVDASGTLLPWDVNADKPILTLAASGSMIYAVGWFRTIGGVSREGIAGLDATTGAVTAWQPDRADVWGPIFPIADGRLFLAGQETKVATNDYALYELDPQTGHVLSRTATPSAYAGSLPGAVFAVAADGEDLFIGGNFYTVGGEIRPFFSALMPAPSSPVSPGGEETGSPAVKISTRPNLVTAHAVIKVRGQSLSSHGIVRVEYRVGDRGRYHTAQGTTKWSFTVHLEAGRNVITVRAVDAAGNRGKPKKIRVRRV